MFAGVLQGLIEVDRALGVPSLPRWLLDVAAPEWLGGRQTLDTGRPRSDQGARCGGARQRDTTPEDRAGAPSTPGTDTVTGHPDHPRMMPSGLQQAATAPPGVVNPRHLVWLGDLIAVGALGVVEWPVVAGFGRHIAERQAKDDGKPPATNR